MSEHMPTSHLDRPGEQFEGFYDQSDLFEFVRGVQTELGAAEYDTYGEANRAAEALIPDLDEMCREEGLMHKTVTLLGHDVVMPYTTYHESGGVSLQLRTAYDGSEKPREVTGAFQGLCCYAVQQEETSRFRPMIGYVVALRPLFSPGFTGHLTTYGPVATTLIAFLDDEIKRELGGES